METKQDSRNKLSAGSYDLNKFLSGGYDKDIITTLYGPPGCGKTNFCMLAAASLAKKDQKVIFIDTEGGFSIERLRQLIGKSNQSNKEENKDNYEKILSNILLLKPTNFTEQSESFSKLLKELKQDNNKRIALIIVDGMTMLYRLELAEARKENIGESESDESDDKKNKEKYEKDQEKARVEKYKRISDINSKLANQMRLLAEIARKENIAVITTNQVYSEFLSEEELKAGREKQVNMVGGDIMKYWSKCIIEIKNKNSKRTAILRKHRSLPEKELQFDIVNEGIRKRGWL